MSHSGALRAMLVVLDAFTGVIAINDAIALTSELELNRFSVELPRATPFRSYQLPGVIPGVWRAAARAATVSAALDCAARAWWGEHQRSRGTVLMGWIVGEVLILREQSHDPGRRPAMSPPGLLMATGDSPN